MGSVSSSIKSAHSSSGIEPAPRVKGGCSKNRQGKTLNRLQTPLCIVISIFAFLSEGQAQQFGEKAEIPTSIGQIGLTVTNIGVIGNSFRGPFSQGAPSCEYPIGSGIEHLFDGGLWVGAFVRGQPLVSTGAAGDDANGYDPGDAGYEFTFRSGITERSSIFDAQFYDPRAISHQDFLTDFSDSSLRIPGSNTTIREHSPIFADVHLESYAWNFPFADFFVILNYSVTNASQDPWDNVYLGLWADFVIRNVRVTAPRGTDFFSHGANGFIDSLQLVYVYDYDGDPGFTDSYVSAKLLGGDWRGALLHPKAWPFWPDSLKSSYAAIDTAGPRVRAQFWGFRSTDLELGSPRNDGERYGKMSTTIKPDLLEQIRTSPGNRLTLISLGPIPQILPGETVNFVLAIVAARKFGDRPSTIDDEISRQTLLENIRWAERAYQGEDKNGNGILDPGEDGNLNGVLDRYLLPQPPIPPAVRVVAEDRKTVIYWDKRAEQSVDPISGRTDFEGYRIYRTQPGDDLEVGGDLLSALTLIAEFDSVGNTVGTNSGFQSRGNFQNLSTPVNFPGDPVDYHYRYEVDGLLNGWQYVFAVTAYDEGDPVQNLQPLESSRLQTSTRAIPGSSVNDGFRNGTVGVYPNPYYVRAAWDGTAERDRKIYFTNLPSECEIRIYTLAGETVDVIHHSSTQTPDIRWFQTFGSSQAAYSGGDAAWDLISEKDQRLATGLYLFAVRDKKTGDVQQGKFAIIR